MLLRASTYKGRQLGLAAEYGCMQSHLLNTPAPSAGMFQRNSSRKRRLKAKLAAVEVRRRVAHL